MRTKMVTGELLALVLISASALLSGAGVAQADDARAEANYRLNCAGCHLENGTGKAGMVPALTGVIGKVFSVPGGREFIGRIPGVANSFLTDEELSELLNWSLRRFDPDQLPAGFMPYSPAEVGRLRQDPLSDTIGARAQIMGGIVKPPQSSQALPAPATVPPGKAVAFRLEPDVSARAAIVADLQTLR